MPGDGKKYTIYSDNLKMNTAAFPELPGYADGGMVMSDPYMDLMYNPNATVADALTAKAARQARRNEMLGETRRKPKAK